MRMILVSALLVCSNAAFGACWEYQIIDTSDPAVSESDKLKKKASVRSQSRVGLINALNRTGAAGWELVSQHDLNIFEAVPTLDGESGRNSEWVATLAPQNGLFRREIKCN